LAYDYSSDNKRLELPNPFRVENSFLFACAVITLAGGVVGLLWAREAIQANSTRLGIAPLLVGVALLAAGLAPPKPTPVTRGAPTPCSTT